MFLFVLQILLACLVAVAAADKLENLYLPPLNAPSSNGGNLLQPPPAPIPVRSSQFAFPSQTQIKFQPRPATPAAPSGLYGPPVARISPNAYLTTLRYTNENNGDGKYAYS